MSTLINSLVWFAIVFCCGDLFARDWFIRAGSDGDGSLEKPFKDPWQALQNAGAGDVLHVAKGRYFGRLEIGLWEINVDKLTLLGGYDEQFKERDPWKFHTVMGPSAKSRDRGNYGKIIDIPPNSSVDGFIFDGREFNAYDRSRDGSYPPIRAPSRDTLVGLTGTLRNSIILNSGGRALNIRGNDVRLENNLVLGGSDMMVMVRADKATIKGNTFLFSMFLGGRNGECMYLAGRAANIRENVFAFCEDVGLRIVTGYKEGFYVDDNVFWMNGSAALSFNESSTYIDFDSANLGEISDIGFASAKGNSVQDVGLLSLDKLWMERFINARMADQSEVTAEEWTRLRAQLELPPPGGPKGLGMPYPVEQAVLLLSSKISQGAHSVKIEPRQ